MQPHCALSIETSLFQTLAGRIPSQRNLVVEGNIYLGGAKFNPEDREHRRLIAYVAQEDSLHETSTPREAFAFSAKLRLPRTVSDDDIEILVNKTVEELGLGSASNTIIGGGFHKGISGGERRRVSIGLELIASPLLIFLDEPTSGLDSFAATQVMALLDRVAKAGNTVLFTIHQPSSKLFSSFDSLILLNRGQIMHQGSVSKIGEDLTDYGYPLPDNYNPADWILDIAQMNSMEELSSRSFFSKQPDDLVPTITSGRLKHFKNDVLKLPEKNSVSVWQEFKLLQQREMLNLRRNPASIIINVVASGILSVIFGVIFLGVGRADRANYSVGSTLA
jgi:ABC-type multidrug transport system ATPase subunit